LTDLLATEFENPYNSPATKNFAWIGIGFQSAIRFVGREDKLAELQHYHSSEHINVAVISGLGGVGKSKLAFQYAKRKKNSTNCVWLRGEDKSTLLDSINDLARQLKLQTENCNGTQEQFEATLTSIRSKINDSDQPWLIILDNVDSMHEFVTPTINTLCKEPNLFIIVTSVLRKVASKRRTAVLLELSGFSDEDADKFINEGLGNINPELTRNLSTTLQSLPLAMDQAVQYIVDQRSNSLKGKTYDIQEFLDEFNDQKNAKDILDYNLEENEKTVFTTVKMCTDRIQALEGGEDTVTLLHIFAYLDPDGVHLSVLEGIICIVEGTAEFLQNRLTVLKDYSLISVENETTTVHRVVQRIVPIIQFAAAQLLLERVAFGTFKSLSTSKGFAFSEPEIRQATVVWNHFKKDDRLKDSIPANQWQKGRWQSDLPVLTHTQISKHKLASVVDVLGSIGDTLNSRRFSSPMFTLLMHVIEMEFYQTVFAGFTEKLGENHSDVLYARAIIIASQRVFVTDLNYLEELSTLIAIAESQLEKGHPRTLSIKYKLAVCLYEDQKYKHALDFAKDIRPFLEESHPLYPAIENLEVCCYKALEDVTPASELLVEQTRKLNALRMDGPPTHPNESSSGDEKADFGKEFLHVKDSFPEFFELLSYLAVKADDRTQPTEDELKSPIAEHHIHIAKYEAIRSEVENCMKIGQSRPSSLTKLQRDTRLLFPMCFTDGPTLLKQMEVWEYFLRKLKFLLSKE
jgi:hypothetical protein